MATYCKHDDIRTCLRVKFKQLVDPNQLLPIYEEPFVYSAAVLITMKLVANRTILCESFTKVIKLPSDSLAETELPISIQDIPANACLYISIWSTLRKPYSVPAASTVFSLFTSDPAVCDLKLAPRLGKSYLRQGYYPLFLWPDKVADTQTTPSIIENSQEMDELYTLTSKIEQFERGRIENVPWLDTTSLPALNSRVTKLCEQANLCLLCIELPTFPTNVIYEENEYTLEYQQEKTLKKPVSSEPNIDGVMIVPDYELIYDRPNPVSEQFIRLERADDMNVKDLRPTQAIKEQLLEALAQPDHKSLEVETKNLIWRYRHWLMDKKQALTKFLGSVFWEAERSCTQAMELLPQWAPIDKEDALHLLSLSFSCNPNHQLGFAVGSTEGMLSVRKYAVERLEVCQDAEIHSILLQLVQAIRYEDPEDSPLVDFLLKRASRSPEIAYSLFWFLQVEGQCATPNEAKWYQSVLTAYMSSLHNYSYEYYEVLTQQIALKKKLESIGQVIKKSKGDTSNLDRKRSKLRQILERGGEFDLTHLSPSLPFPFKPSVKVTGVVADRCTVFLSKQLPFKVCFETEDEDTFEVIYKQGDDMRQDQLIIQMVSLMNDLLKKVNLDMCLTPYTVMATSSTDGYSEFVPNAHTLFDLIHSKQSVLSFLLENQVNCPDIMDTFVKSCAGYCVITYLLGIGDRHLENLLLDNTGRLFHIDFGFILGKDPKPMPPPMKLCKEMVDAMGGEKSKGYETFKLKCCECFIELRKHCKLIVNLFYLMIHSGLPGLAGNPEKIIDKLHDRFRMDLNDEEAETYFLDLINESVSALMPQIMERLHVWALYWRKL